MASRSLGQLTFDLVAKIGGFTAGMDKAERDSAKAAKEIERNLQSIGVASVAVGTAIGSVLADGIRAAANAFPELIDQAAAFQDIADKTGGSAEGFANFAVSAKVAGVEMETIATASTKLSKALFSADEESKGAAEGLKSLGIELKTIQGLRPDEQIKLVAEQFGKYADGANKAAVAQQIFGKNGAELLKFFKDYVDNGGDVNILTGEMIQKADDFADASARLKAQLSLTAAAFATEFIDPLNALIKVVKDAALEIYNLDTTSGKLNSQQAIKSFAESTGQALAGAIDYVKQSVREFNALIDFIETGAARVRALATFNLSEASRLTAEFQQRNNLDAFFRGTGKANAKSHLEAFNEELQRGKNDRNRALLNAANYGTGGDNRPQLAAQPTTPRGGTPRRSGGGAATRQSEAERYLQSLQKQLEKTQELTTQEQVLQDIQMGRLGAVSEAQKEKLLQIAGEIDANKQLAQAEKDRLKAEAEAAKARKALMDEGAALTAANRAPIEIFIDDQKRTKELLDAGAISADTYSRQMKKLATAFEEAENPIKKTADEMDQFAKNAVENIQKGFGDTLVELMEGNFEKIGDGFMKMLRRMVAEALAAKLARSLFGDLAGGEGSGVAGDFLKSIGGALFGGARATGGPVAPNTMYRVNERGPEVFQAANGDQFLMTGNQSGRVNANAGAGTLNVTYVVPGRIDVQTQTQLAQKTRRETLDVARRF